MKKIFNKVKYVYYNLNSKLRVFLLVFLFHLPIFVLTLNYIVNGGVVEVSPIEVILILIFFAFAFGLLEWLKDSYKEINYFTEKYNNIIFNKFNEKCYIIKDSKCYELFNFIDVIGFSVFENGVCIINCEKNGTLEINENSGRDRFFSIEHLNVVLFLNEDVDKNLDIVVSQNKLVIQSQTWKDKYNELIKLICLLSNILNVKQVNNHSEFTNWLNDFLIKFKITKHNKEVKYDKVIDNVLLVDLEKKQIIFLCDPLGRINSFESIIGYQVIEDGDTITSSNGFGKAAVGGILFGATGAIVGSASAKHTSKKEINKLSLLVKVNDIKNPIITIDIIKRTIEKGSRQYEKSIQILNEIVGVLEVIINNNNLNKNNTPSELTIEKEIELLEKLEQLLNNGIITKEEFEKKKNEILKK